MAFIVAVVFVSTVQYVNDHKAYDHLRLHTFQFYVGFNHWNQLREVYKQLFSTVWCVAKCETTMCSVRMVITIWTENSIFIFKIIFFFLNK